MRANDSLRESVCPQEIVIERGNERPTVYVWERESKKASARARV